MGQKTIIKKTIDNMDTFFNPAHKEELKKITQGTDEANHAIAMTPKLHQMESLSVQQS